MPTFVNSIRTLTENIVKDIKKCCGQQKKLRKWMLRGVEHVSISRAEAKPAHKINKRRLLYFLESSFELFACIDTNNEAATCDNSSREATFAVEW